MSFWVFWRNCSDHNILTLTAMSSLARSYITQASHGDAESLLVRVLTVRERTLGLSHLYTQNVVVSLARVLREIGPIE
jgi:hypothetical protein